MTSERKQAVNLAQYADQDAAAESMTEAEDAPLTALVSPAREKEDTVSAGVMVAGEAGSMPNSDNRTWEIEVGTDVICTGGHKLGEVVAVEDSYIVVEKGFFTPEDFFVPKSAIDHLDQHALTLNVSKDKALHSGWDEEPDTSEGPATAL